MSESRKPHPESEPDALVHLVRHGPTVFNEAGRLQGWSDAPLTLAGELRATTLGRALRAEGVSTATIHCADTLRHLRTAELLAGETESALRPDRRLREMHFGDFEGMRAERAWARAAELAGLPHGESAPRGSFPGDPDFEILPALDRLAALDPGRRAERSQEVAARAFAVLAEIADEEPSGAVIAVTSGITIMVLLAALGDDLSAASRGIDACSVTSLARSADGWRVISVNDTARTP